MQDNMDTKIKEEIRNILQEDKYANDSNCLNKFKLKEKEQEEKTKEKKRKIYQNRKNQKEYCKICQRYFSFGYLKKHLRKGKCINVNELQQLS